MTELFHNGWLFLMPLVLLRKGGPWRVRLNQYLTAVLIAGYVEALLYVLFYLPIPVLRYEAVAFVVQGLCLVLALVAVRRIAERGLWLYGLWADVGEAGVLAVCQALILALGSYGYLRLMPSGPVFHCVFVTGTFAVWMLVLWILSLRYEKVRQRQQLQAYRTYLPIVEELLEEVRLKQHDYHNELQSIRALALTCEDLRELKERLLSESERAVSEPQLKLLKLNLHLLAGFLISRVRLADRQGKGFALELRSYVLESALKEYELIEYMGILIDNALEATDPEGTVYASLDSADGTIVFEIKNPGPKLTPLLCRQMFERGYTTRDSRAGERGLGLYKLSRFAERTGREIFLENEELEGVNYLVFRIVF